MLVLVIIVLFAAFLAVFALACHTRRARARAKADRIIAGKLQTNATEIDHCIKILTSTEPWPVGHCIEDLQRIDRLRDIRNTLIRQRNSALKNSPLSRP